MLDEADRAAVAQLALYMAVFALALVAMLVLALTLGLAVRLFLGVA